MQLSPISVLVALYLASPSLADAQPVQAPRPMFSVGVQLKGKAIDRSHALAVADNDCAEVSEVEKDHNDQLKVCAVAETRDRVMLRIEWTTRNGSNEYRGRQALVVARGAQVTLGAPSTTHLVLDVK